MPRDCKAERRIPFHGVPKLKVERSRHETCFSYRANVPSSRNDVSFNVRSALDTKRAELFLAPLHAREHRFVTRFHSSLLMLIVFVLVYQVLNIHQAVYDGRVRAIVDNDCGLP